MFGIQRSIRSKLILAFMIPLVGVVTFAMIYMVLDKRSQGRETAQRQVETLSEMLAFSVGAGLGEGNFTLVETAFEWAKSDGNVAYIAILDEDRAVLFEENQGIEDLIVEDLLAMQDLEIQDDLLKISVPVRYDGTELGSVLLVYSMEAFNAEIRQALLVQVLINLLLLAAGVGFIVWFSGLITRKLDALREATRAVGQGDLDARIEVDSQDEIGDLAEAFRKMVADIRAANEAVRLKQQDVEEEARRTEEGREYLAQSIDVMLKQMERFAEGDLTVRLEPTREDDIARLFKGFNRAVANIRAMIGEVRDSVQAATGASVRISEAAGQLSAGAREQQLRTESVFVAIEQMTKTIRDNSSHATRTSDVASSNGLTAQQGGQVVLKTVEKIRDIAGVVQASAETVEKLGQSSDQISAIVANIRDIADRTNLLALNAAIEAARAGEHGKGFAVVADEVGKLAENTSRATEQVGSVIAVIRDETRDAVTAMKRGEDEVSAGIQLADQTRDALDAILKNINEIIEMIAQIAAASEEQSSTSEEIIRSVEAINEVIQHSAEDITRIVDVTHELNALNDKLLERFARFKLGSEAALRGGVHAQ